MTATTQTLDPNTPPHAGTPPPGSRPNTTLRRVLLVIGSVLIILMVVSAGMRIGLIGAYEDHSGSYEISETFTAITVDGTSVEIEVSYGPVDTPVIDFDQRRSDLVLEYSVRGSELQVVVEPRLSLPFWIGSWDAELRLTLPEGDDPHDLSVRSTAGDVTLDGDFGAVRARTSAGDTTVRGSAASLDAGATAGSVIAPELGVTGSVRVEATAGDVDFSLTELPSSIDVNATATDVWFEIPPGEYRIDASTTVGSVTQNVSSHPGAEALYRFRTTAGSLDLFERG